MKNEGKSYWRSFSRFQLCWHTGGTASYAQAPAEICYAMPVPADCADPPLNDLLTQIGSSQEASKLKLRSALVDKLINRGYLDSALIAARSMKESPSKDVKLVVIGTLYAAKREFARARAIESRLNDPEHKRSLLTSIVTGFVRDGEVEPAWQLVKEIRDQILTNRFQASLVNQFALEQRFELAWQNLQEIESRAAQTRH